MVYYAKRFGRSNRIGAIQNLIVCEIYMQRFQFDELEKSKLWYGLQDKLDTYAWYFRNALVRANYNDLKNGIHETTEYLELFLRNLLLDEKNELHNRSMHISGQLVQSASNDVSKCQNGTLKLVQEELTIVKLAILNKKSK